VQLFELLGFHDRNSENYGWTDLAMPNAAAEAMASTRAAVRKALLKGLLPVK